MCSAAHLAQPLCHGGYLVTAPAGAAARSGEGFLFWAECFHLAYIKHIHFAVTRQRRAVREPLLLRQQLRSLALPIPAGLARPDPAWHGPAPLQVLPHPIPAPSLRPHTLSPSGTSRIPALRNIPALSISHCWEKPPGIAATPPRDSSSEGKVEKPSGVTSANPAALPRDRHRSVSTFSLFPSHSPEHRGLGKEMNLCPVPRGRSNCDYSPSAMTAKNKQTPLPGARARLDEARSWESPGAAG